MDSVKVKRLVELREKRAKDGKLSDAEEGEIRLLLKEHNSEPVNRMEMMGYVNNVIRQFENRIGGVLLSLNAAYNLLIKYDILTRKEIDEKKNEMIEEAKRMQAASIKQKQEAAKAATDKAATDKAPVKKDMPQQVIKFEKKEVEPSLKEKVKKEEEKMIKIAKEKQKDSSESNKKNEDKSS